MPKLDDFTELTNFDNRFKGHMDKEDEIIVGGTSTHVFILPFKYSEYVVTSKLLYKQGLFTVLEKGPSEYELKETEFGTTILTVKLTSDETKLFNHPLLDTYVQMQIHTVNDEILYNKLNKIKVIVPIADILLD